MRTNGSVTTRPRSSRDVVSPAQTTNLADLLERVLDKGIVIAGDITLFLGGVQLLTLRIRLLVASIDKAQEIGINWWQFDPALSSRASARAKELEQAEKDRNLLNERLDRLERLLPALPEGRTAAEGGLRGVLQEADQKRSQAGQRSNAAAAYVLDPEGRMIAELKQLARQPQEGDQSQTQKRAPQPGQQLHEDEQPQAQERPPQPHEDEQPRAPARPPRPEAAQAEQPAGGGPLVGQDLHERISQAMRRVLEEVRQRNTQAPQPVAQAQPSGQRGEEQPAEEEQPHALERAAQPGAAQTPAPARVRGEESRMSGTPQDGRVTWHLAVADLDREEGVIAELEQPVQQAHEDAQPHVQEPEAEQNAASAHVLDATSAYVLDRDGSMIAELRRRAQQPPEEERPQAPERAERPQAEQTEQPAGGRALVGQALQEQIAQAIRPVLGVVLAVHVGIAQAPQEDEQEVAPAAVLDREGRVIAALKPSHEQE